MAATAIIAVIHDIIFSVGVYALFQFEVTPGDGHRVPHDPRVLALRHRRRVRQDPENQQPLTRDRPHRRTAEMVNRSLNAVLMRSLSTTIVALLPVLSLLIVGSLIMGATALEEFALALAVGLAVGSYSSIFVAAPLLAAWKDREPQYRSLHDRRRRVVDGRGVRVDAACRSCVDDDDEPHDRGRRRGRRSPARPPSAAPTPPSRPRTPRPRQQRRRKRR